MGSPHKRPSRATARDRPYYTTHRLAVALEEGLQFAPMGQASALTFLWGDMPRAPAGAMMWHIPRLIFKVLHCVPTYFRCLSISERTVRYDSIIHYDVIH